MSANDGAKNLSSDQYLYGLPFTGTRRLVGPELDELKQKASHKKLASVFWSAVGVFAIISPVAYLYHLEAGGTYMAPFPGIALALVISMSPLLFYMSYSSIRSWRAMAGSIRVSEVRVFEGALTQEFLSQIVSENIKFMYVPLKAVDEISVELYYDKNVLYTFNDSRYFGWNPVRVFNAAHIKPGLTYKILDPQSYEESLHRRILVEEELREIKGYFRRRLMMLVGIILVVVMNIHLGRMFYRMPEQTWVVIIIASIAVYILIKIIQEIRGLKNLWMDASRGYVLSIPVRDFLRANPELEQALAGVPEDDSIEIMQHCGLVWREGDAPSPWRKGKK